MKSFGNNQTKLKINTLRADGVVQNDLNMGVAAKNLRNRGVFPHKGSRPRPGAYLAPKTNSLDECE